MHTVDVKKLKQIDWYDTDGTFLGQCVKVVSGSLPVWWQTIYREMLPLELDEPDREVDPDDGWGWTIDDERSRY